MHSCLRYQFHHFIIVLILFVLLYFSSIIFKFSDFVSANQYDITLNCHSQHFIIVLDQSVRYVASFVSQIDVCEL